MNVSCPECSTVYRVDPAKVPQGGVRARCSTCNGVIPIGVGADAPRMVTPSDPIGDAFVPHRQPAAPFIPPGSPGSFQPARRPTPTAQPAPRMPTPRPQPGVQTPQPQQRIPTPPSVPRTPTPAYSSPALGASLPPLRPTPRTPWQAVTPPAPAPAPAVVPVAPVSVPPVTPPPSVPVTPAASPAAPSFATTQSTPPAPGERRPINPFLARDPGLRAKRLARALVSDMVAYYPAKHSEGLEKGNLKELFRDEIKKSYDEYVAQVGADYARTTTHFQESLKEVLGAGKKIF